jgi:hypothetical protein
LAPALADGRAWRHAGYPFRYFAADGGLMSYGFDQLEQWRGAATYVDRSKTGRHVTSLSHVPWLKPPAKISNFRPQVCRAAQSPFFLTMEQMC